MTLTKGASKLAAWCESRKHFATSRFPSQLGGLRGGGGVPVPTLSAHSAQDVYAYDISTAPTNGGLRNGSTVSTVGATYGTASK